MLIKVLIAENDVNLAFALAARFAKHYFQMIELRIVTDGKIIRENPEYRNNEILIYNPELLLPEKEGFSASEFFCLTDSLCGPKGRQEETRVSRSRSSSEIFSEIVKNSRVLSEQDTGSRAPSQLIVVTGAAGGTGKTTVAMGVAAELTRLSQNVLFICGEQMQSFRFLLKNKEQAARETLQRIKDDEACPVSVISGLIRKEAAYYLPPIPPEILCSDEDREIILKCIRMVIESGEYDYVIVDTDCVYDYLKKETVQLADCVIIVYNEDRKKEMALELAGIEKNSSRILLVCNRKRQGFAQPEETAGTEETESIEEFMDYSADIEKWFAESSGIRRLARRII